MTCDAVQHSIIVRPELGDKNCHHLLAIGENRKETGINSWPPFPKNLFEAWGQLELKRKRGNCGARPLTLGRAEGPIKELGGWKVWQPEPSETWNSGP